MKRKISLLLVIMMAISIFIGCGNKNKVQDVSAEKITETKEINFAAPDGLTAVAVAKLIKEKPEVKPGYNINYTIEKS